MDDDLELVKRYLTLISRIAARGASSPDPDHIRDTLLEVCFALGKYSGFGVPPFSRADSSTGALAPRTEFH
jgi:hypothetical protein